MDENNESLELSNKSPIIHLEVNLPQGQKDHLMIYEDDNLEDLVEIFSNSHRKLYFLLYALIFLKL